MMHIVYSVFNPTSNQNQSKTRRESQQSDENFNIRLVAHQQVCHKYHDEIVAIRKYMPQWEPKFSFDLVNE
jgi:hypothetical protein